jgi:hypothetical protein
VKRLCGAKTRANGKCAHLAMPNGRCRYHGGKSTGPKGPNGRRSHGAYELVTHGRRTPGLAPEALAHITESEGRRLGELRELTDLQRARETAVVLHLALERVQTWRQQQVDALAGLDAMQKVAHAESVVLNTCARLRGDPVNVAVTSTVGQERRAQELTDEQLARLAALSPEQLETLEAMHASGEA